MSEAELTAMTHEFLDEVAEARMAVQKADAAKAHPNQD